MKLKQLYIKDFKNIKEQTFDFSGHNGLTVVIGNNSSGKSNLLEAICSVFGAPYGLDSDIKDFSITYSNYSGRNFEYKCEDGKLTLAPETKNSPKRIVAIYSGEETRLWDKYFFPPYIRFIQGINKSAKPENIILSPSFPHLLFLNKFYWNIALLTLLCSDSDGNMKFCKETLGIEKVNKIEFKFADKNSYGSYSISDIIKFIQLIDSKNEYSLEEFKSILNQDHEFIGGEITMDMLFQYLYLAYSPKDSKILNDISIIYNDTITVAAMSEGQKKMMLVRAAYEFAGQEDTIFLLDEPDAHVHLANKRNITTLIGEYSHNRHTILTSHSPTLCKYVPSESIILMENGAPKPVGDEIEAGKYLADNDDVFKLLFTINHIVVTEGKTDCQYIKKTIELYRNEYPELTEIEFVSVGGTDGEVVQELLTKIRKIERRKIIVLVDRDEGGLKCAKKVSMNDKLKLENIETIELPGGNGEYIVMIPNQNGIGKELVIEDYFGTAKIKELSIKCLNDTYKDNVSMKSIPNLSKNLKSTYLKNFCQTATRDDMKGFIPLLNKLKEIITDVTVATSPKPQPISQPQPKPQKTLTITKTTSY